MVGVGKSVKSIYFATENPFISWWVSNDLQVGINLIENALFSKVKIL